jgi:hypothetical protein
MDKPPGSSLVQVPTDDQFLWRPIAWIPLLFTSIVVFGGWSADFLKLTWANALVSGLAQTLPSIETWAEKSFFSEVTRLIFALAWLFSVYYAVLIACWVPYRTLFLRSLVNRRRHLAILPVVVMGGFGVFFLTVTFPEEPHCTRNCVYESAVIQVLYSSVGSFLTGYGLAMLYWWLSNFSRIHFDRPLP